jgi:hypothetical protein
MKACIIVGLSQNILWLFWASQNYKTRPYAWKMILVVVSITLAMSFEILDFPPLFRIIDAHSLWHAATIPIVDWIWQFAIEDAQYEVMIK